jgi:hypothetical protein
MSPSNSHPQRPVRLRDQLQYSPTFRHTRAPRRPDGEIAWFTYEHYAHLEDLLDMASGSVLAIYQAHLVEAAQRVLAENGDESPPPYDGGDPPRPPSRDQTGGAGGDDDVFETDGRGAVPRLD